MSIITAHDFISSYNHTLSSTFSHHSLPLTYHSQNWSFCSNIIPLPTNASALALSPDESMLAMATGSDVLIYITEPGMSLIHTLKGHNGWVSQVEWYGEKKLVSGSSVNGMYPIQEETVRFWDLDKEGSSTGVDIGIDHDPTGPGAFGKDPFVRQDEWLNEAVFTSEENVAQSPVLPGCLPGFGSLSLSPDGRNLFYFPTRRIVGVVSTTTLQEKFRLEGHTDSIMWVGASPDGRLLATSSWDRTVKIWDLQDGNLFKTLVGTKGQNWSGSWSPDGKLIAVGSGDKTVRVWDVLSGNIVHLFGGEGDMFYGWVRGLGFDPSDGHSLVASSVGGTVRIFDMGSGECTNLYQIDPIASSPLPRFVSQGFMEISYTLKYAPSSSERFGFKITDGRLVVYDVEQNEMWEFIQDKEGSERIYGPGTFVFAKGGRKVYSADMDGTVRVWNLD